MKSNTPKLTILISLVFLSALRHGYGEEFLPIQPDTRVAADLSELPTNPFTRIVAVIEQEVVSFSEKFTRLKDELFESEMRGLVWHSNPENRSIMFGNTPLREGQVIPGWLASDGSDFRIVEIGIREVRIEHIPNGSRFPIPFTTRKSYQDILDEARPPKAKRSASANPSPQTQRESESSSTEPAQPGQSGSGGPAGKIMPEIETFTREAVSERRRKEDELFFLEDQTQTSNAEPAE